MQIVNDVKPVIYLKSKTADVLKYINETDRPMMKFLSFAEEDIRNENLHTEEDVFNSVEELLNK